MLTNRAENSQAAEQAHEASSTHRFPDQESANAPRYEIVAAPSRRSRIRRQARRERRQIGGWRITLW